MTTGTRKVIGQACLAVAAGLAISASPVATNAAAAQEVPAQPALPFPIPPAPPYLDPAFYQPDPARVSAAEPGEILAARQVNLANFWLIPLNVNAWQLSYRSTNTRGEPIAAVATVAWSPSNSPRTPSRSTAHPRTPCRWDRCRTR